jgi:hypothetical protein
MPAHVIDNGSVNVRPAYSFGVRMDNGAGSDRRDIGCGPADIDNGYGPFVVKPDARADCSRQPFFHHVDPADMRVLCRCKESPLFDVGYTREDTHHRATAEMRDPASSLPHEIIEHRTGPFKVGNYAIDHRSDNCDFASFAPEHPLRFSTDRDDLTCNLVHRDD